MSRPSAAAVREFELSAEFVKFFKALQAERFISTSRALDFWPLSRFANTRDRRQKVSALLTAVTRQAVATYRSNADSIDPTMVRPEPLRSARVIALMPDDIIGSSPIHVLSHVRDQSPGLESLGDRLRERIPQSAELKKITIYYYTKGFYLSSPFCAGGIHPLEYEFSKGVLDCYHSRVAADAPFRLGRNELLGILSNPVFLNSPNICLFMSEIRRRIPQSPKWETGNSQGGVRCLFPQACYRGTEGERRFIAFAGCLPADAIQLQPIYPNKIPLEFW